MPEPLDLTARQRMDLVERVVYRYGASGTCRPLSDRLAELALRESEELVFYDPDSEERQAIRVTSALLRELSLLVLDVGIDFGKEMLEARSWLENLDDLGGLA